ncbi:hypothetical protein ECG_04422 [Echinococcus granulosus]|uniref:Expressed conserved protein n=1 Tax=Echinococcus granulosus TaxID=6210 RepID=U6J008_ECHGR|nr:hypothetical protein EGR_00879 [Echinococcus granulosus]EUB64335.1 hypothetical protein EGR_00879 [Echinococcus granulosus]KAH9283622.1 hypothetical protein ECG_04422 [Echinococcus granulosus]CDS17295.1 expressed conserved protein [Echinococcus granulosus]
MHSTAIYGILVIFAYVESAPLRGDSNLEEIDRVVYFGTFEEGSSMKPSKALLWIEKRCFGRPSGSGLVASPEGTEAPTSPSATAAIKLTENISEVPKLHSSFGSDSTVEMQSTFSPLKVHYDDYNYPILKA